MKRRMRACVCVGTWLSVPGAFAGDGVLTLEDALQRARERAAPAVSARWRMEEARARARGARLLRDHPAIESAFGGRSDGSAHDFELGLSQTLELGGARRSRIAAADAAVELEAASAEQARVLVLRDVALAFLRALAAAERVEIAEASVRDADEVLRIAARRLDAGDVTALDVNLAENAAARARSEQRSAAAAGALARGELRVLIAMDPDAPLSPAGDLRPRPVADVGALLAAADTRPDIAAIEAERRAAAAEAAAGRPAPELTPGVRWERDDGTRILWAGLTVTLPLWNRGQEARAVGAARGARLAHAADALRRSARQEVASAYEAYGLRVSAASELDAAAERTEENEALARRSYEEGQIGLGELLLVRREGLEVRALQVERRLAARELETELLARAGVLR